MLYRLFNPTYHNYVRETKTRMLKYTAFVMCRTDLAWKRKGISVRRPWTSVRLLFMKLNQAGHNWRTRSASASLTWVTGVA